MDPKLLELLVCPVTKGPLDIDRERQELVSRSARLAYPIRDGIPVLLEEEARTLIHGMPPAEWKAKYQSEATPEQLARMQESMAKNAPSH